MTGIELLSDIVVYSKYAKYIPELKRRETYNELVARNKAMHMKKYPGFDRVLLDDIYKAVLNKEILPSMRSMQFAGKAIEVNNSRLFNCSYTPIDDVAAFQEIMFLLLSGCGVGYSVQKAHIAKLPPIQKPIPNRTKRYLIGDSIEGWSDAVKMLMKSYFYGGPTIRFDYSDIRPKGTYLVTSGGKAPGPAPLRETLVKIDNLLAQKDRGSQLTPIEAHDIACHIADAVLAGGIRRCLRETELVETKTGIKRISDIAVGDYIKTIDGYRGVVAKENTGVKPTYTIYTRAGIIESTAEHRHAVLTSVSPFEYRWVETKDLTTSDVLIFTSTIKEDFKSSGFEFLVGSYESAKELSKQLSVRGLPNEIKTERGLTKVVVDWAGLFYIHSGCFSMYGVGISGIEAAGEHDTYDIEVEGNHCFFANGLLTHNSAMISLFSVDDTEMLGAKSGVWWELNPQRGRANNSATVVRSRLDRKTFNNLWERIRLSGSGEPGIFQTNDTAQGVNPCFAGEQKLLTKDGYKPFKDLAKQKTPIVLIGRDGKEYSGRVFKSGVKNTVKLIFHGHHTKPIICTPNHKFLTIEGNEVTAENLKGRRLCFDSTVNYDHDNLFVSLGFIQGDGQLKRLRSETHKGLEVNFGEKDDDIRELFNVLFGIDCYNERCYYLSPTKGNTKNINELLGLIKTLGFSLERLPDRELPKTIFDWSKKMILSFLRGLYSANGSVNAGKFISLKTTNKKLADGVVKLFSHLGIKAYITKNKSKEIRFSNGVYKIKKSYNVCIANYSGCLLFYKKIGFVQEYKNKALFELLKNKAPRVRCVESYGNIDVYDFTIDNDDHWGFVDGVVAHNCGEISLRPNTFCNLVEINVSTVKTQDELERRAFLAASLATLQAGYTDFHYLRDVWKTSTEKDALIGVSMTGIASVDITKFDLKKAAEVVKEANAQVAGEIGINEAARCTTVKPAGCRPKDGLVTTSSGIYTLEELMVNHPENQRWYDVDGSIKVIQDSSVNRITKTFRNGVADVYRINMHYGMVEESTSNHKWFVKNKGFVETKDLAPGDVIEVNLGVYRNEEHKKLINIKHIRKKYDASSYKITMPEFMSEDLAWLVGYLWGNGAMSPNKNRIRFMDRHLFNIEKAKRIIKDIFGISSKIHRANNKDAYTYEIGSVALWEWLHNNGIIKYIDGKLNIIPLCIRESSYKDIIAFIAGLSDADGCVYYNKKQKAPYKKVIITQSGKREHFTRHVQKVAASVGLVLGHSYNTKGHNYQNGGKNIILMNLANCTDETAATVFMKNSTKCKHVYGNIDISHNGLPITNRRTLGKVVSVEYIGKKETFDVEIEGSPWFFAGAVKSHNTSSLVLGTSSGIHAWHDKYYIRRLRLGKDEALYKYLLRTNPQLLEDEYFKPDRQAVLSLPIKAPAGAITRDEGALAFLERVKYVFDNWIVGGHRRGPNYNNVSATVSVKDDEWSVVGEWMWKNRQSYSGLSVLPYDGGTYKQAPLESISESTYYRMNSKVGTINVEDIVEEEDNTDLQGELACAGGSCEIKAV